MQPNERGLVALLGLGVLVGAAVTYLLVIVSR